MLQPNGHQGIWFETAPGDPLGKLVYEAQRFVGDPVELELLGDRALMPEWADMPDPCSAEVMLRMGELGLASISEETGVTVFDLSYCGAMGEYNSENYDSSIGGVSWSIRRQVEEGFLILSDLSRRAWYTMLLAKGRSWTSLAVWPRQGPVVTDFR